MGEVWSAGPPHASTLLRVVLADLYNAKIKVASHIHKNEVSFELHLRFMTRAELYGQRL